LRPAFDLTLVWRFLAVLSASARTPPRGRAEGLLRSEREGDRGMAPEVLKAGVEFGVGRPAG
jgi:hypothetical protein